MKKIIVMALAGLCPWILNAQTHHADCTSAIAVCDTLVDVPVLPNDSNFMPLEINPNFSCLGNGEVRGQWYKFGVNSIGNLRFTITPYDTLNDFDWALFRVDWGLCTDIFSMPSYEVSCDFSGINGGFYTTGADGLAQQGHQPAVNITTPALFYLYITTSLADTDAVQGYRIDFTASDFDLTDCMEIGLEDYEINTLHVYPNPADNRVYINTGLSAINPVAYSFTDLSGRQVTAGMDQQIFHTGIDVSGMAPGVYVLQVTDLSGRMYTTRVMVRH